MGDCRAAIPDFLAIPAFQFAIPAKAGTQGEPVRVKTGIANTLDLSESAYVSAP